MTVVSTTHGQVRGQTIDGVVRFAGIPFAAPPFGPRRFRPPQPVEPWTGVRDAIEFGAGCPQPSIAPDPQRIAFFNPAVTGEDCLNLNVWTPDAGAARLPVMVWIHGGGYMTGGGAAPVHDGSTWARDGVVYVSVNYRMHVEGFLNFGGEAVNLGLLDHVAALEWVRDNIAGFGGDPDNVTIFGQSGGAVSVMHLLAMPAARGLFRRAIAQSGSTLTGASPAFAARVVQRMAEIVDRPPTTDGFRDLPIDVVLPAVANMAMEYFSPAFWGADSFVISPFRPVIDGEVLPASVEDAVASGASGDVDLMAGATKHEATFAMQPLGLLDQLNDVWVGAALDAFGLTADDLDVTDPRALEAAWTDWAFRQPAMRMLDAHVKQAARTYAYEFSWPSPTLPELGATHALEIPFVTDMLDAYAAGVYAEDNQIGPNPPQELATRMHTAWISFARTGDPGWPQYDGQPTTVEEFTAP